MKIVIHSFTFWPMVGGIETTTSRLAQGLSDAGHLVTVLTETPSTVEPKCSYTIVRTADVKVAASLIVNADLVFSLGSLRYFPKSQRLHKPFVLNHPAYQLVSIDGFGWANDRPAPLDPWSSYFHHLQLNGTQKASIGLMKLLWRRRLASMVDANVAVSRWQGKRLSLPRQHVIYNPIDFSRFQVTSFEQAQNNLDSADATFTFLGRLISEKGVDDLIRAFASVVSANGESERSKITLKIIGDGPKLAELERLADQCGVRNRVIFLGSLVNEPLAREISKSGICVLPSAWEEPMGITAVELMAAGKPLIVSNRGGLAECAGKSAVAVTNRDVHALSQAMTQVLNDTTLQKTLMQNCFTQIKLFDPSKLIQSYIDLFEKVVTNRVR